MQRARGVHVVCALHSSSYLITTAVIGLKFEAVPAVLSYSLRSVIEALRLVTIEVKIVSDLIEASNVDCMCTYNICIDDLIPHALLFRAAGTGQAGQAKTGPLFSGLGWVFYLWHGKDRQIINRTCLINSTPTHLQMSFLSFLYI